jgi:hypothetical protein
MHARHTLTRPGWDISLDATEEADGNPPPAFQDDTRIIDIRVL